MQRPETIEAIGRRYSEGFASNVSEDEIRSELWQGWGTLLDYIAALEQERDGLAARASSLENEVHHCREYIAALEAADRGTPYRE